MQKFLTILLFFSALCSTAQAVEYPKIVIPYFEGNSISPNLIDPPSTPDSAEKQQEVAEIIKMQKKVKPQEIAKAHYEYGIAAEKFVKAVDPNLDYEKYPELYKLLIRSRVTAQEVKDQIKDYWKSPHPYQVNKKIRALGEIDHFYSYPSGHASKCYVLAYIMGSLIPEEKEAFLQETEEMLHLRVLIGEHFPSDIAAGKKLAEIIYDKMLLNKDFQRDFHKAALELKNYQPIQQSQQK